MLKDTNKKMFVTSSFQTHSIPLLHIIKQSEVDVNLLFINTGFHFPETLQFRNHISNLLNWNYKDIKSNIPKNLQQDSESHFFFTSDPDYCCYINKTKPLEDYLNTHDIWINGIRSDQNKNRSKMDIYESTPFNAKRFHPMLDWNSKMIYDYRQEFNLPEHPLDNKGYVSIGCEPCTRKFELGDERSARWFGMNKLECGLHTDLVERKL